MVSRRTGDGIPARSALSDHGRPWSAPWRYDDPNGTVARARKPMAFWFETLGLGLFGLYLLGVAFGVLELSD